SETAELLKSVEGLSETIAPGQPVPPFDYHLPLVSLPRIFKTRLETIPAEVPYLKADPGLVEEWRGRIITDGASFRVGLVWAGNPMLANERRRSMSLSAFAPLAQSGAAIYSLQKGPQAEQLHQGPPELKLID